MAVLGSLLMVTFLLSYTGKGGQRGDTGTRVMGTLDGKKVTLGSVERMRRTWTVLQDRSCAPKFQPCQPAEF